MIVTDKVLFKRATVTFLSFLMIVGVVYAVSYVWCGGIITVEGFITGEVTSSGTPQVDKIVTITISITNTKGFDVTGTLTVEIYESDMLTLETTLTSNEAITVPTTGWVGSYDWTPTQGGDYYPKATFTET